MEPKLIMMIGLPGSGKSTKAEELAKEYDAEIFASDKLREEMFGNVNHQADNGKLFTELHRRVKNCLREGKSALIDATNLQYKKRMAFLKELKNIPCEKIAYLMATPYEECIKNNEKRERKVPRAVIDRMYRNFDPPARYEGFDGIIVDYALFGYYGYYRDPEWFIDRYANYDQFNHHHSDTLGIHSRKVYEQLIGNRTLEYAGMLHDCGKTKTASFTNTKGEESEECHYYQHHCVSSYDALFYEMRDGVSELDVSILCRWHMTPYFWQRNNDEKMHEKYKNLWGEKLYNDIMKLHEADVGAH